MSYIIGIDYGLVSDETAFAVIDSDTNTLIHYAKAKTFHWDELKALLYRVNSEWKPKAIWAEASNEYEALLLSGFGIPIKTLKITAKNRYEIVESLKLALENGQLKTLEDFKKKDNSLALEIAWYGFNFHLIALNWE